jgi:hypothetical protein
MILISGPDVMLDGGLQAARSRGNKVRFWHLADMQLAPLNVCFKE